MLVENLVENRGIYKIVNNINGKIYIGSAKDFKKRYESHVNALLKNKHHNRKLQNGVNKYKIENFTFVPIEYIDDVNQLIVREQYYLDLLNPYYNICKVAGNSLGCIRTKKTRKLISQALKGKVSGKNNPMYGKPRPDLILRNKLCKGKIASMATRLKMRANSTKIRKVSQFSRDGVQIAEFSSISDAYRSTGVNISTIVNTCKGNRKSAGGYIWKYSD
jgi:group I intron endonuclease